MEDSRKRNEQLIVRVKAIFASAEGRKLMQELCKEFHVFSGTYSDSAHVMYFREGQRSVIWDLINWADVDLDELRKIWKEDQISLDFSPHI